jgi:hypothetical protein
VDGPSTTLDLRLPAELTGLTASRVDVTVALSRPERPRRTVPAVAAHFGRLRVVDPAAPLVPGTEPPPTWAV